MNLKRYREMTDKELAEKVKKTRSDRSTMRLRLGHSVDLTAYDKQLEELNREIARRRDGEGTRPT